MQQEHEFFRLVNAAKFENFMVRDRANRTRVYIEKLIDLIEEELKLRGTN